MRSSFRQTVRIVAIGRATRAIGTAGTLSSRAGQKMLLWVFHEQPIQNPDRLAGRGASLCAHTPPSGHAADIRNRHAIFLRDLVSAAE